MLSLLWFSKARPSEMLPWVISVVPSAEQGPKISEGDMRNPGIRHMWKEWDCH